jgi:hypothetical protein
MVKDLFFKNSSCNLTYSVEHSCVAFLVFTLVRCILEQALAQNITDPLELRCQLQ